MKKTKMYWILGLAIMMLIILVPNKAEAYSNYFKTTKYKITEGENKILTGLDATDLTVKTILSNVLKRYDKENYEIKAFGKDGKEKADDSVIGTGSTLRYHNLKYNYSIDRITIVVYGDTNGDGKITASDALAIIKNKTGKVKFEDKYYLEAGRITEATRQKNAEPSAADALAIIKYKLGKASINQYHSICVKVSSYEDLYTQLQQCNTNLEFDTTASNYQEMKTAYEKLEEVVATYCKSSMSETIKALVLHDYLVTGTKLQYKVESFSGDEAESNICNMGKTMNEFGFTVTYNCLLGIAGIKSRILTDRFANRPAASVNEVTIDGEIYYVSCGADSYISEMEQKGKVRRYFFLRNTEQLKNDFWEQDVSFYFSPNTVETSTSTKYYGVRWPEYRPALDYQNSEIKLATGKTIVRTISELKTALLNGEDYIVDVMDADTESVYEVDEFCKKVIAKYIKPEMTQAEKALEIHDFICANFMRNSHTAYNERTDKSNSDYDRAWGYYKSSLLSGMGDCINASSSFNTLCAYVGIETQMVSESEIPNPFGLGNHHWSLVKIDGEWYHCDPEGGDFYAYGKVDRLWFLYSDTAMMVKENTVQPCTSTKYDEYKWPEFKGLAYYQDKTGIIDEEVPPTSFWVRQATVGVVGDTFNLMLRVFPYGAENKATYISSNPEVAKIDDEGNLTVLSVGSTTITVKVGDITKSFTMKTHNVPRRIKIVDITLKVGETKKVTLDVTPEDAVYNVGSWYIRGTDIATVDEEGNVTGVSAGTAYINMSYDYTRVSEHVYSTAMGRVTVVE